MKHLSLMIKPASSLCNLRCKYCFYADVSARREVASHGIMTRSVTEAVLKNVFQELDDGDALAIAFQGGEPTLAGLDFFKHFVEMAGGQGKRLSVSYALQTNGILLDREWCRFLRQNHFLVGLSLDGYAENHNQCRLNEKGGGTFAQVLAAKRLLDEERVSYNLLCTLTNSLARHPQRVWKFLLEEHVEYVQFTPCLGDLDSRADPWRLTPKRFYSFYASLFPLWLQGLRQGRYVSVKFFDDIVNLFVRREITACGIHGQCQIQNIVEANGAIYPCDFYVLDKYCGGNLAKESWHIVQERMLKANFLKSRENPPPECEACKYKKVCCGGCKRMSGAMYLDATGFCGYRQFLDDYGAELCSVGARLLQIGPSNGTEEAT